MTRTLLVATRSPDKLHELRSLLGDLAELRSLADAGVEPAPEEEGIERFETFAENALAKARYFHRRTGLATLADDSGLCVEALGGAPGVHSRRFAPRDWADRLGDDAANNAWLLDRLRRVPAGGRSARYRCALALVEGEGREMVAEGEVEGRIGVAPRGVGGFGYDPLFVVAGPDRTFAELPPEVKGRLSHRARAARALRERLLAHTGGVG